MNEQGLSKFMEKYYRATETSKQAIRLSEIVGDILRSVDRFCEKNGIPMEEGLLHLIDDAGNMLNQISETQTLPLHKLLKRPTAWLPNENQQRERKGGQASNSTEPD